MNSDSEDLAGMGNDALISKIKDFDPETMEDEHAYEKDEEFIAHSLNHRQSADNVSGYIFSYYLQHNLLKYLP